MQLDGEFAMINFTQDGLYQGTISFGPFYFGNILVLFRKKSILLCLENYWPKLDDSKKYEKTYWGIDFWALSLNVKL